MEDYTEDYMEDYVEDSAQEIKHLPVFSFPLTPTLSLTMTQQNNTQNHGTTVWDSSRVLAYYLMDSVKRLNNDDFATKNCIELGSGCGLGGLAMAACGYDVVLTDLQEVIDRVLGENVRCNQWEIRQWMAEGASVGVQVPDPKARVTALDWIDFYNHPERINDFDPPYSYIVAADCIYSMDLIEIFLTCIYRLASPLSTILVSLEHRDDLVVNHFVSEAKRLGFEIKLVPKKLLRLSVNEDVEIWKLKKKRVKSTPVKA
ncbi:putative methyltransferase-domain-containing protein [Umbelopsis sp. AD052]|nr:putative methyltransferase-domain-containing protein [Umbelopsis sp. AD052]